RATSKASSLLPRQPQSHGENDDRGTEESGGREGAPCEAREVPRESSDDRSDDRAEIADGEDGRRDAVHAAGVGEHRRQREREDEEERGAESDEARPGDDPSAFARRESRDRDRRSRTRGGERPAFHHQLPWKRQQQQRRR